MKTNLSLKHIPPQAIELEESVLSSCFVGHSEKVIELLKPDDFYRSAHQTIFSTISDLTRQKIQADLPSVVSALRDAGKLEEVGGASYLSRLIDEIPTPSNVEHYARKIRDKAILRKLIEQGHTIIKTCYEDSIEIEQVIDDAQKRILGIDYNTNTKVATPYSDLSIEAGERYENLSKRKGAITGIASGFYLLDSITCGFQKSDLIIIAGRPSMGKTALVFKYSRKCREARYSCCIFFS